MAKTPGINPLGASVPRRVAAPQPGVQGVSAVHASAITPGRAVGPDVPQTVADVAQSGNLPAAEANALVIDLRSQMVAVKDDLRNAQAELAAAQAERDHAKAELETLKSGKATAASTGFDPTKAHIVVDRFHSVGAFGTLSYEAHARVDDPIVLQRLHHLGAKLAPVPK